MSPFVVSRETAMSVAMTVSPNRAKPPSLFKTVEASQCSRCPKSVAYVKRRKGCSSVRVVVNVDEVVCRVINEVI
jgi:hypothetical protein